MWKDILNKGYWSGEIWNQHKNGQIVIETLTISSICDENGGIQNYIGLFSDITSIKKQQEYLEHIAHYDMLTHLPNRVLLADRLQYAISQTHRRNNMLAVIFLDLDGFKIVNDEYGHKVGDSLLISLSTRMKNIMRDGDTLARIGGDEFIIVLVDLINIQNSIPIINRLLMSVSEQVVIDGFLLNVTASLGVTFYPQEENLDADQLYRQADQAMYQAKLTGKNRYHIFDEITDRNMRGNNVKIEHIRNALANNEFVLYYQPKVNMRSGVVIGVEALIRWNHPENGILGPVSFLQVIEDHPLATEIGKWVIKTALVQMDIWRSIGLKLPISVNVSAIQLQQLDFVQYLRKLLIEHPDTCSGDLEIEVLETTVLKDIARASVLIEEIRSLGIIFSLDDFGTGYSSLTYLKRLPVKILKIDQSFVYNMLNDADDLSILEGIINLANAFHCTVIAEGVELIEHGEVLLQLGCNLAQGYGIAKPMPGNQIHEWVINWSSPPSWVNCKEISYNNRKILHAIIEHRIWIMNKIDYIKGKNTVLMDMDSKDCVLGKWLNSELLAGHRFTSGYIVINKLHEQVHLLADELCHLRTNGYIEEALTRLNELYNIGDSLIYEMKKMALNN
jgi:diguanylate cyclase (GGDEF)-like protein